MNIEFTTQEHDLLIELLDRELKTMPVAIHHTKLNDYKAYLKEREAMVEKLYKKVTK